jgi:hypothetical protein
MFEKDKVSILLRVSCECIGNKVVLNEDERLD